MTALKKYQRLECQGLWRETPEMQRRDVIVSFREATLIISDGRSDTALTHWSLPAVERMNPGLMPAVFAPGDETGETLELDDRDMIEALETVHQAVEAQKPHPGRMRQWMFGGTMLAMLAMGVFWLPGALVAHTAKVVPEAKRQEIGRAVLADLARVTGTPCSNAPALPPLSRLLAHLFGPASGMQIAVMRDSPVAAVDLPGGLLLINRQLIEEREGPDVAAGYLLAERLRAAETDPLVPVLRYAGVGATFHLLTTGTLPQEAIHGYAEVLLARKPAAVADATLLEAFRTAGVPSTPYAHALDPKGAEALALSSGDPFATGPLPRPILGDNDWVALQGICTQ